MHSLKAKMLPLLVLTASGRELEVARTPPLGLFCMLLIMREETVLRSQK